MNELTLIHVGDQHMDVTPPRSRKDDYFETMKSKMVEIRELAHKHQVKVVTWSGDMINRKEAHRVPYVLTNWLINFFWTFNEGYPTVVTNLLGMGNHDIHNTSKNWHKQPIGALVMSGCITPLWVDPTADNPTGYVCVRVVVDDLVVGIHGRMFSYEADTDAHRFEYYNVTRIKGERGFDIAVIHTELLPNGTKFIADYSNPSHIDAVVPPESRPNLYLCGHVHDDYGVFLGDGYRCLNYGAISRGSIDEYNLSRRVKVALVTIGLIETGKYLVDLQPLHLESALPAEEVFFLEEMRSEHKKRAAIVHTDFKLTAENIRETFSIISPDEAVSLALKTTNAPKRVADRVHGYIDRARQVSK